MTSLAKPPATDPFEPLTAATCPHPIARPLMSQRWEQLTMLHWRLPPAEVERLLPPGLVADTIDGSAWVTLVPFVLRVGPGPIQSVPWLGHFAETNVRTYVRDRTGRPGIYFLSLDAPRLAAVVTARAYHGLPYQWSQMAFARQKAMVHYRCRRRWPDHRGACSAVSVEVGPAIEPDQLTELDVFLTARWSLFSPAHGQLWRSDAAHEPWPLQQVEVVLLNDELMAAAGLPVRGRPDLAHFSESVTCRISTPHRTAVG